MGHLRRAVTGALLSLVVLVMTACAVSVAPSPPEAGDRVRANRLVGTPSPSTNASPTASSEAIPPTIGTFELVADGFRNPTSMIDAGGGRFLVAERSGRMRYVGADVLTLDLSERIGELQGDQGLFGMALHPLYPADPRLFVAYSSTGGATVLASYELPPNGMPITAAPETVIEVPYPDVLHYGGHMAFGPDGYLYLGLGDGGPVGDPRGDGQNPHTLLGTILRLDVAAHSGYAIPEDNPFVGGSLGAPEVWLYGLRHPWRFSFDRETGDLWIGDVGEEHREEIDLAPAGRGGLNFGWSRYEGTQCFRPSDCDPAGLTMPVAEYQHAEGASGVVGGYVYRGAALGSLVGRYLYGDIFSGRIWALDSQDPDASTELIFECRCIVTSFAEDTAGELYVVAFDEGAIYRLAVPATGAP